MNRRLHVTFVACLVLAGSLALAAAPVIVFPNPIQLEAVSSNSTSFPLLSFISNASASAVTVSGITISGTNSAHFAFYGFTWVEIIWRGQSCQKYMTFSPLTINESGFGLPR
jgi:hypothetical protein